MGVVVFREKLNRQTVLIILICILGAAMVANIFGAAGGEMDFLGILAGIVNGFGVALQIMIPRYFVRKYERDTMLVYGFLGAAVGLSFLVDFETIAASLHSTDVVRVLVNILCLGLLCTMVANVSVVKATAYINTTTCSILSSLEVVVGAIVGILIFKESMTFLQVIGAVIVVSASLGPTFFKGKTKSK